MKNTEYETSIEFLIILTSTVFCLTSYLINCNFSFAEILVGMFISLLINIFVNKFFLKNKIYSHLSTKLRKNGKR